MPLGEGSATSKLTNFDVLEIRERYDSGEIPRLIAEDIGISRTQVVNIGKRLQWRHI